MVRYQYGRAPASRLMSSQNRQHRFLTHRLNLSYPSIVKFRLNPVPHPLRNVTWIPKPWRICAAAATFVGARTLPQPPHTTARSSALRCSYLRSSCHARSHHLHAHNAASNSSANPVTVPCHVVPCRAARRRAAGCARTPRCADQARFRLRCAVRYGVHYGRPAT